MKKEILNVAASVRQRLLNRAKETNRPFDELLQYYAIERFLYRVSRSEYRDKVTLKGALMFVVWDAPRWRATRDIDFLGHMKNTMDNHVAMVKQVCTNDVEPDGIVFDVKSVKGERIKEDADYEGVRILFAGRLDRAVAHMQIDFGFGDSVTPAPISITYPTLLDMPGPQLRGYPRETVVAEKFEAMVNLGILNSRMKDFFDIWLLANHFDFEGKTLAAAIKGTFAHRKTILTLEPIALSNEFAENPEKAIQWNAFLRKSRLEFVPKELKQVIRALRTFLIPIAEALIKKQTTDLQWTAPGPWREPNPHRQH